MENISNKYVRVYELATDYLKNIKPDSISLDEYFWGDNTGYTTLNEVFYGMIYSAQNYQFMPNVIKLNARKKEIGDILFGYDFTKIRDLDPSDIYYQFRAAFQITSKDSKLNAWYKWSKSVIDSAKFISEFDDTAAFDKFVRSFEGSPESMVELPLLIKKRVNGIGFALACNFLKELGYTGYAKPDVHIKDIFTSLGLVDEDDDISVLKAVIQMANDSKAIDDTVTPYKVDKVLWLICSGKFYKEVPEVNIGSHKREFIQYALSNVGSGYLPGGTSKEKRMSELKTIESFLLKQLNAVQEEIRNLE